MLNTRDFDAMLAEKAGIRPTFKVGGQEFTLRAKLPWAKFVGLLAVMSAEDSDNMAATQQFFNTVLIRDDRSRFRDLLEKGAKGDDDDDDDDVIDISQMSHITEWVLEHFTGKHRMNTGGSAPGSNGTGQSPNVVSLSSKKAANA